MFRSLALFGLAALLAGSSAVFAQTPSTTAPEQAAPAPPPPRFTVGTDVTFYGDNTEFANQFRSGETIVGAHGRLFLDTLIDTHATLRLGVYMDGRAVSEDRQGQTRAVYALILAKASSRFIFGTLETVERREGFGPDLTTLHGLLPPIERETLSFTRPYETGLQWTVSGTRVKQEAWINWQRLNTADHRELFDSGVVGRVRITGPVHLGYQWHIVHHGGQQFASGPVSDSYAITPGVVVTGHLGSFVPIVEWYWVHSSDDPNRAETGVKRTGSGNFLRAAIAQTTWRIHAIVWRGSDFIKEEGDTNYQSVGEDGLFVRRTRDYYETGVTKLFLTSKDVFFEGSFRLYRIENTWSYAYRLLAKVNLAFPLKGHQP